MSRYGGMNNPGDTDDSYAAQFIHDRSMMTDDQCEACGAAGTTPHPSDCPGASQTPGHLKSHCDYCGIDGVIKGDLTIRLVNGSSTVQCINDEACDARDLARELSQDWRAE